MKDDSTTRRSGNVGFCDGLDRCGNTVWVPIKTPEFMVSAALEFISCNKAVSVRVDKRVKIGQDMSVTVRKFPFWAQSRFMSIFLDLDEKKIGLSFF